MSLVVVAQNNAELVRNMLKSLISIKEKYPDFEVIVVDNASVDGTADAACSMRQLVPRLTVVRRPLRRPLAENRNLGAALSRGELLLFCDSDVVFEQADFLDELVRTFAEYQADILCPLILNSNDDRAQSAGLIRWGLGYNFRFLFGGTSREEVPPLVYRVDMVHGACFAVSREAFRRLGGFDEVMDPYNFDEMDLAIRARKLGMRLLADTRAYVRHLGGGTTSKINRGLRGYLFIRHMFRSMIRNEGWRAYPLMLIYAAALLYAVPALGYGNPSIVFGAVSWALRSRRVPLRAGGATDFVVQCP
ncbi:MAG: glycosyltransferase family 2 protein [Conexivisphaera sp.]